MTDNPDFWKRKLLAFLHDPPHKAMDFSPRHEEIAVSLARQALQSLGWDEETDVALFKALKDADRMAAAADRVTFPTAGKASATFTGKTGATFRHPLGASELGLSLPPTAAKAEEILQHAFGGIKAKSFRELFFFYWRRWMEETVKSPGGESLACFPADTRIPDHTVWTHMSVASALQGCRTNGISGEIKPAFLVFQLGPVQDFIAAARSTRDLWSGSYLLSWLTAHAMKAVTDAVGPDAVIFPTLRGQGIFDVLHRELYESVTYAADDQGTVDTLWERMYLDGRKQDRQRLARLLLNPTLPNRFLALVPAHAAAELARAAEQAVRHELQAVSACCWQTFAKLADTVGEKPGGDWQRRWDAQVAAWAQIAWCTVPWEHDIVKGLAAFAKLPVNRAEKPAATPATILSAFHAFATQTMPVADRDSRYYTDTDDKDHNKGKTQLNNAGFLWSANVQTTEHLMAARRNTREFAQFATDRHQDGTRKDALTGKEEVIGSEELWRKLGTLDAFRDNEGPYGAITLIKRLWCRTESGYLFAKLGIDESLFHQTMRFESVEDVAAGNDDGSPYVAVLAVDGDEMGKWISGTSAPKFLDQLAPSARAYFEDKLPNDVRRPISPSYHMQFSEALANFSNHFAGRVVAAYQGQLIYAGGDDVLAMLPADKAFRCAQTLRAVFRGTRRELPEAENRFEFAFTGADGFMVAESGAPLVVPGPAADLSCGIAIGHFKHPLQALVKEARIAESRAKRPVVKNGCGRSAFAVSLLKRGGETVHWGAQWDSPALPLYDLYRALRGKTKKEQEDSPVSAKFPYALAALLRPYMLETGKMADGFDPLSLVPVEFDHVLCRQTDNLPKPDRDKLRDQARAYLAWLAEQYAAGRKAAFAEFETLFLTAAFISRQRGEED